MLDDLSFVLEVWSCILEVLGVLVVLGVAVGEGEEEGVVGKSDCDVQDRVVGEVGIQVVRVAGC